MRNIRKRSDTDLFRLSGRTLRWYDNNLQMKSELIRIDMHIRKCLTFWRISDCFLEVFRA